MSLTPLNAISPIDGRYRNKVEPLAAYFSEEALIKYRVMVEVEYFIALCELPLEQLSDFNQKLFKSLRKLYKDFSNRDAKAMKEIERTTNHDVKAVEYFLKEKVESMEEVANVSEFIHFCCTSEDINNLSYALCLEEARANIILPTIWGI